MPSGNELLLGLILQRQRDRQDRSLQQERLDQQAAENAARQSRFDQKLPLEQARSERAAAAVGTNLIGRGANAADVGAMSGSLGASPELQAILPQLQRLSAAQQQQQVMKEAEGLSSLLFAANESGDAAATQSIGPTLSRIMGQLGPDAARQVSSLAEANFRNLVRKDETKRSGEERRDARQIEAEDRRAAARKESPTAAKKRKAGSFLFENFRRAGVPFEDYIQQGYRQKVDRTSGESVPVPLTMDEIVALREDPRFIEFENRQKAGQRTLSEKLEELRRNPVQGASIRDNITPEGTRSLESLSFGRALGSGQGLELVQEGTTARQPAAAGKSRKKLPKGVKQREEVGGWVVEELR